MEQQNRPALAGDPKFKPSSIRFQIRTKTTYLSIFIGTFGSVDAFERKRDAYGEEMYWVLIPVPAWVNLAASPLIFNRMWKYLEMFLLYEEDLTHVITGLRGTD